MPFRDVPHDDAAFPAGDAPESRETSWRYWLGNGVLCAIVATALLVAADRAFVPPPEEPPDARVVLQEGEETIRWSEDVVAEMRERSRITDAIKERCRALEARRLGLQQRQGPGDDGQLAALDAEIRRLDEEWLAEMRVTHRLMQARNDEFAEKQWQRGAARRERVAKHAWGWRQHRTGLLATAACAWALAGWMLVKSTMLRQRQRVAEAAADHDAGGESGRAAAVAPRRASTDADGPTTL